MSPSKVNSIKHEKIPLDFPFLNNSTSVGPKIVPTPDTVPILQDQPKNECGISYEEEGEDEQTIIEILINHFSEYINEKGIEPKKILVKNIPKMIPAIIITGSLVVGMYLMKKRK